MDRKGFVRADVREKVTGQAHYADDLTFPGMLYARTVHCPHPRAEILKIDGSRALTVTRCGRRLYRSGYFRSQSGASG